MINLLTIIGARPQIIKAAALSRAISSWNQDVNNVKIKERILHTGQHYDQNMSKIFFDELNIPKPFANLHVGSGNHGEQTAKMIVGIENILNNEHFDGIILYGDTNSTLAGAIAASKLEVPIFHIEAGLRSYNMQMPEEINRITCDHLSSILFAPTKTAYKHLAEEGLVDSLAVFPNNKKRLCKNVGDLMFDNSLFFAGLSDLKSNILKEINLKSHKYILATIHRDNNTDNKDRLTSIFRAIMHIADQGECIVLPLHPRTKKLLPLNIPEELYEKILRHKNIHIIPPVSFLEMISLEKNAALVMTDSGGVQKEAFFFKKPCIILRSETEWVEIIENNAGIIADANYTKIINAYNILSSKEIHYPSLFGNGQASSLMIEEIVNYIK